MATARAACRIPTGTGAPGHPANYLQKPAQPFRRRPWEAAITGLGLPFGLTPTPAATLALRRPFGRIGRPERFNASLGHPVYAVGLLDPPRPLFRGHVQLRQIVRGVHS